MQINCVSSIKRVLMNIWASRTYEVVFYGIAHYTKSFKIQLLYSRKCNMNFTSLWTLLCMKRILFQITWSASDPDVRDIFVHYDFYHFNMPNPNTYVQHSREYSLIWSIFIHLYNILQIWTFSVQMERAFIACTACVGWIW